VSSSGEPCCLMRTVHWESLDVCLYDVIISLFCVRCAET
jgi:hypothetical protein